MLSISVSSLVVFSDGADVAVGGGLGGSVIAECCTDVDVGGVLLVGGCRLTVCLSINRWWPLAVDNRLGGYLSIILMVIGKKF